MDILCLFQASKLIKLICLHAVFTAYTKLPNRGKGYDVAINERREGRDIRHYVYNLCLWGGGGGGGGLT